MSFPLISHQKISPIPAQKNLSSQLSAEPSLDISHWRPQKFS